MLRSNTCALFLTHRSDAQVNARALEFVRLDSEACRTFVLFDLAGGSRPASSFADQSWTFDSRTMNEWGYPTMGPTLVPGHAHFPLLRFFSQNQTFDYYWTVEYDVVYTGDWSDFFDSFSGDDSDLIACHVRRFQDEPDWFWWPTLTIPPSASKSVERIRGFFVVARYSKRALVAISEAHAQGWKGHFEALIPTALTAASQKISDIGGTGPFTPLPRRNRFYSSFSNLEGDLRQLGTVRFRPTMDRPGRRPNYLYHPVKEATDSLPDPPWRKTKKDARAVYNHLMWRLGARRRPL